VDPSSFQWDYERRRAGHRGVGLHTYLTMSDASQLQPVQSKWSRVSLEQSLDSPELLLYNGVSYAGPKVLPKSVESARWILVFELLMNIDTFPGFSGSSHKLGWMTPSPGKLPPCFPLSLGSSIRGDLIHLSPCLQLSSGPGFGAISAKESQTPYASDPSPLVTSYEAPEAQSPLERTITGFF
jgi:hypothetical protein